MVHEKRPDAVAPNLEQRQPRHVEVLETTTRCGRVMEHPLDDSGHQQGYPVVDKVLGQPNQHHPPGDGTVLLAEQLAHGNQLPAFGHILIYQSLYIPQTY